MAKEDSALTGAELAFADEMVRLRKSKKWSQEQLARSVQFHGLPYVNQSTISRIEQKTRQVRLAEAQAIATVFNRSVESMTTPSELHTVADDALRYVRAATDRHTELKYHMETLEEDFQTVHQRLLKLQALAKSATDVPPLVTEALEQSETFLKVTRSDLRDPWVKKMVLKARRNED